MQSVLPASQLSTAGINSLQSQLRARSHQHTATRVRRQDSLGICKEKNTIMALYQLNPEKNPQPSCKATLGQQEWKSYNQAYIFIWERAGRIQGSKSENAVHPIHPFQPYSTKKSCRRSSSWLINIGLFFLQRLPASQQFLLVAFLPYKLLAGAELIWSQWELLSSFIKETKPRAWLRDAQRL